MIMIMKLVMVMMMVFAFADDDDDINHVGKYSDRLVDAFTQSLSSYCHPNNCGCGLGFRLFLLVYFICVVAF